MAFHEMLSRQEQMRIQLQLWRGKKLNYFAELSMCLFSFYDR